MSEAADVYVFDTSAWLSLIEDEAGADVVQELLEKARTGEVVVLVSFMSFMEVYYITLQESEPNEAQERVDLMASLPVLRVESTNVTKSSRGRRLHLSKGPYTMPNGSRLNWPSSIKSTSTPAAVR